MNRMSLNRFCGALILLAALEFSASAQPFIFTNAAARPLPRRASIIVIQAEGLGWGDLSCNGQTQFQTPNLDKLAADGIRFTNYYAGAADGKTARAVLQTGRDAAHLPADADLTANDTAIAQVLQRAGYRTGLIGDWMLGDEHSAGAPWKKGFEEFAGYLNPADAKNFYADYIFRYAPRMASDPEGQAAHFIGHEMLYHNTGDGHGTYLPDLLTTTAINFIKEHQPDRFNHYRPFFLWLNYKIPAGGGQVPTDAPYSEEPWPQPEKNRAAMIARLDNYVGEIQEQLQKLNLTNNTAIFFTSDTVPKKSDGIDPLFFHSVTSTNDLRVPMIAVWPERIPAGQVSGFVWTAADLLPTLADIAFLKPPAEVDGASVLPTLIGQPQARLYGSPKK